MLPVLSNGMQLNFTQDPHGFKQSPSSKYVVYATACVYREFYGKITDPKKIV